MIIRSKKLRQNGFVRKAVFPLQENRGQATVNKIIHLLDKKLKIMDFGAGACVITKILRDRGYSVTPVDVKNYSSIDGISPVISKGKLPFKNQEFDVALILFVLHHTKYPEKVLRKVKRVARKIIILEDIYCNQTHQYFTHFLDSLSNREFLGHPHSNKTDSGWRNIFNRMGLRLKKTQYSWRLGIRHALYYLEVL